jgi:hypothetical protein
MSNQQGSQVDELIPQLLEEVKAPLFEEAAKGVAILLVDASASTMSKFDQQLLIFDKFLDVVKTLGHTNYRVIFWNSPQSNEKYPQGTYMLPFVVKPDTLSAAFAVGKSSIVGPCLTCTHLGFNAIPNDWFHGNPTIYLITDGEMGWGGIEQHERQILKNELAAAIRRIANNNVRLNIITVENINRDFNQVEVNAAGSDVYNVISESKLTGLISQFVSYTPNGKFVQINKNKPPKGCIPYGEKYFSEFRTREFMDYVQGELKVNNTEDGQLKIAQNLSSTLDYLTRDKPRNMMADIIKTFSGMFSMDQNLVRFILTEAIEKERAGSAGVYSNYRAQLKNLFAQADALIKEDVRNAIGLQDNFVGYPIAGRVLTGSSRLVDKSLTIFRVRYPNAAYAQVPVFPLDGRLTELQEQCLRQWTRAVFAAMYNTNVMSDEIIYLVLGVVMLVVRSSTIADGVKDAYRRLGTVILRKKRLNSNITELQRLESGELPIPNSGKIEEFFTFMNSCCKKLNIETNPMKLWYEMCSAMGGKLFAAQSDLCLKHPEYKDEFKCLEYHCDEVPQEAAYDYNCIITLDDISSVGGYRIMSHQNAGGNRCEPVYLLSAAGKDTLLGSQNPVCPVCYNRLSERDFSAVGRKIPFELPQSYENKIFENAVAVVDANNGYNGGGNRGNNQRNARGGKDGNNNEPDALDALNNIDAKSNSNITNGTLVILKGVVGAGKSTWAAQARAYVEAQGRFCTVEGTDQYCKDGMHTREAVKKVERNLHAVLEGKYDRPVVIIDTCGESCGANQYKVFGTDFNGWKKIEVYPNLNRKNVPGYLAWSLRNVLTRKAPKINDNWYLNAESAGNQVCIDVHSKKSKALGFGGQWKFAGATVANLSDLADEYAKGLTEFKFDF